MQAESRVGRPRDPEVDGRILAAAFEIMSEVNFRGLRADALATRAGVPKSTIYRRWPSLAELAVDAIDTRLGPRAPQPTDDPLADISTLICTAHALLLGPGLARTLVQLAMELVEHPEASGSYRARVIAPLRDGAIEAVQRAIDAGLWRGPDATTSVDLMVGAMLYRVAWFDHVPSLDECFTLAEAVAREPLPR